MSGLWWNRGAGWPRASTVFRTHTSPVPDFWPCLPEGKGVATEGPVLATCPFTATAKAVQYVPWGVPGEYRACVHWTRAGAKLKPNHTKVTVQKARALQTLSKT